MTAPSNGLTIGEVAVSAGVSTSAIRYYEAVGILPAPARENGQRRYGASVFRLLAALRFAQRAGFSVAEIRTLFHGFAADVPPARRWQALAEQKLEELDAVIERAQRMKDAVRIGMRCGCLRFEDCLTDPERGCCLPGPPMPSLDISQTAAD